MSYQLIQQPDADADVICPCCQQAIIDWSQEQYIQPCEHTLFVALDLGFEYIADVFEATMARSVDEIHAHDDQLNMFQELTTASFPHYLIIRTDLGVQDLSRYIGIAVPESN
ncbi:hypothetical protein [Acinetobacter indicus]|uniref:hypothetical protein n=1 Tax=Acinetobacter indicus TaxID=756892 RepID=UPI001A8EAB0B|nr:hypothetical protein [Acinetobacter indicus]QSQ96062.1 hypothetical protein J0W33_00205 [Acinetobacter indicus]